ncbi:MAG: hypothetical protein P8184_08100 [Calditrichia bacterium]
MDFYMTAEKEIADLIDSFYKIISGSKDQPRDWELFRALFVQDARLLPLKALPEGIVSRSFTVEEYINRLQSFLRVNDFYEFGENYRIEIVNHLAHACTEYRAKNNLNGNTPLKQGVNLIHFINDGKRWLISFMQWEDTTQ